MKNLLLERERNSLSKYAAKSDSKFLMKRLQDEEDEDSSEVRLTFQRDRDRIIHSRAFRRLMHKTQVFNANMGDHYRNRLTHTMEVSQIARSIGKYLGLNDELIEAIALGHDLGHTPFGHIGERTLHLIISRNKEFLEKNEIKIDIEQVSTEGFKHNFQALQVVDNLEKRSNKYKSLNLSIAVRDGILKHTGTKIRVPKEYGDSGEEVNYSTLDLKDLCTDPSKPSITLEGQVVAIADEIAQCTHDLEDGIRSGIIKIDDIKDNKLVSLILKERDIDLLDLRETVDVRNILIRHMVGYLVKDVSKTSEDILTMLSEGCCKLPQYENKDDIWIRTVIKFSDEVKLMQQELSGLITKLLVSSQRVAQSDSKAKYIIIKLFKAYFYKPQQLPDYILDRYYNSEESKVRNVNRSNIEDKISDIKTDEVFIRLICDHISGMTDQYAAREYKKLYEPDFF